MEKTYSIKDLMARYAVGEHSCLQWIRQGDLTAINVAKRNGGKPQWRVTQDALEQFELRRTKAPPQPQTPRRKSTATPTLFYK